MASWGEDVPREWPRKLVGTSRRRWVRYESALTGRDNRTDETWRRMSDALTPDIRGECERVRCPTGGVCASRPVSARRLLLVTADGRPVYEDAAA